MVKIWNLLGHIEAFGGHLNIRLSATSKTRGKIQDLPTRATHMAPMQGVNAAIPRGCFGFKLGKDTPSISAMTRPYSVSSPVFPVSSFVFPVPSSLAKRRVCKFNMAENQSSFSFQCGKQVIAHGRLLYVNLSQKEPLVAGAGASSAHPSAKNHGKAAYLGQGLHSTKDGLGFDNLSTAFQTYLSDLEAQIRTVSNENYELKKAFTHLFALVNETNIEVRSLNAKIPDQVASLVEEKLDNLDARMLAIHGTAIVAVDNLKEMRKDISELAAEAKGKEECNPE